MGRSTDSKTRLLDAAARVVASTGAAHLTLDAVAAEAGLSKGGVLYHFPTKRALLQGMLDKLVHEVQERAERFGAEDGATPLAAWILAEQQQSPTERATSLALLANAAEDPSLLEPARALLEDTFATVTEETQDPDLSLILLLAAEGMRFLQLLELLPLTAAARKRLFDRLLALAPS